MKHGVEREREKETGPCLNLAFGEVTEKGKFKELLGDLGLKMGEEPCSKRSFCHVWS